MRNDNQHMETWKRGDQAALCVLRSHKVVSKYSAVRVGTADRPLVAFPQNLKLFSQKPAAPAR